MNNLENLSVLGAKVGKVETSMGVKNGPAVPIPRRDGIYGLCPEYQLGKTYTLQDRW